MILFTLSAKKKTFYKYINYMYALIRPCTRNIKLWIFIIISNSTALIKKNVLPDNIYWQLGVWYRCCSPEVEFCFDVTSKSFSCMFMMRTHLHIRLEHLPFSNFSVDPIINLIETNILFCTNKTNINGTTITTFPQLN